MKNVLLSKIAQGVSLFLFTVIPAQASGTATKPVEVLKHSLQKEQRVQQQSADKMNLALNRLIRNRGEVKAPGEKRTDYPYRTVTYTAADEPISQTEYSYDGNNNLVHKVESAFSESDTWIVTSDYKAEYDNEGRPVYNENYELNEQGELAGIFKAAVSYDAYGNQVYKEQFRWDPATKTWNNYQKESSEFRADGQTVFAEGYYWAETKWEGSFRELYTYNEAGMLIKYEDLEWEGEGWIDSYYSICEYDAAKPKNLTLKTEYEADYETGEVIATDKAFYTYNEKDEYILILWKVRDGEDWTDDEKYEYGYTDGMNTKEEGFSWDGSSWVAGKKWEGSFDAKGRQLTSLFYYPDAETGEPELSSKYTYAFDENGNKTLDQLETIPYGSDTKELIMMQKVIGEFDEASRQTLYEAYAYNSQTGYGGVKKEISEYTGHDDNQRFYKSYKWNFETKDWENDMKEEFTYNTHELMVECIRFTASTIAGEWEESEKYDFIYTKNLSMERQNYWVKDKTGNWEMQLYVLYYYDFPIGITPTEHSGLNIYTLGNRLFVTGTEAGVRVLIFDFTGKLVKSVVPSGNTLSISLPQGGYLVKAGDRSVKVIVK